MSSHRLNKELDLQSLFGLLVHSCTHWLRPRNPLPPSPHSWVHVRGRGYWSAKIDDILFETPWWQLPDRYMYLDRMIFSNLKEQKNVVFSIGFFLFVSYRTDQNHFPSNGQTFYCLSWGDQDSVGRSLTYIGQISSMWCNKFETYKSPFYKYSLRENTTSGS
jgi:hypothetical protein